MTVEWWKDYSTFVDEGWKSLDALQRDLWQNMRVLDLDACMGGLPELTSWQPWLSGSTDLWQVVEAASSQFQQASLACLGWWGIGVPEDTSQNELAQLSERLQQQKDQLTSQKRQIATQKRTITTQKAKLADQKQQILELKKSLTEQKKSMAEQHQALLDLQKQQKALQAAAAPSPRQTASAK